MIVAFMNPLVGGKKNGSTIPMAMNTPASARFHHGGSRSCAASRHWREARAPLAHPASLVSSPSRPRGRRIMMAIR